ncbi:hypothetical protein BV902_21290 [Sphingobacterium sp. B29]|uniref:hypothetical protein n=1 Tax=Sphingobacterium sp. B29 TaxID=1933220 RepID=UPI0009586D9E|nr:hypothetical protein [Sphingobacterium sp. B29]APU98558.1 hypothetical protein BV902_21290 [Sphingobacterium sp. B29]
MIQYLTDDQIRTRLKLGKSVEQWLGDDQEDDYIILKWLRIDREKDKSFSVVYFESFDEGNEDFMDIYAFSLVDSDEPFGVINIFPSIADALEFARFTYKASSDKYVPAGIIQEEYRDHIKR